MHLSIVFPTLHKVSAGVLLASRLRELCGPEFQFEVVIVTPDVSRQSTCSEIRFVNDEGGGVYAAYTCGLREARGAYAWLMGDDDFPLDSFAKLVPEILSGRYDLIVAPVIYSSGKYYRPTRSPLVLLFRNWCQQGIVYRTCVLRRFPFHRRLRVQADHFVNVRLFADTSLRVVFMDEAICLFGAHGLSSRGGDLAFRKMRPILARHSLSLPQLTLFRLLVAAADLYKFVRQALR